jgi:hypothetical protein
MVKQGLRKVAAKRPTDELWKKTVQLTHYAAVMRRIGEKAASLIETDKQMPIWQACQEGRKAVIREDLFLLGRKSIAFPYSEIAVQFELFVSMFGRRLPRKPTFFLEQGSVRAEKMLERLYLQHPVALKNRRRQVASMLKMSGRKWQEEADTTERKLAKHLAAKYQSERR